MKVILCAVLLTASVLATVSGVEDGTRYRQGYRGDRRHPVIRMHKSEEGSSPPRDKQEEGKVEHPGKPHRRMHGRHHGNHRMGRKGQKFFTTSYLPDWAAPWLKGEIDLGPSFKMDWDIARFFHREGREWWKGPNVCLSRDESEETLHEQEEAGGRRISTHHFYTKSYCDESDTAYRCTSEMHFSGKKKTFTVTYECCNGYQREEGKSGCPKEVILKDLVETTKEDAELFAKALESVGIDQYLSEGNFTIFAPTDEAFKAFAPKQEIETNVVIVSPEMRTLAEETRDLLMSHVVEGNVRTSRFEDEKLLETKNPRAQIRINIYDVPKRMITANCVPIEKTDQIATNGVVHVVGEVLSSVERSLADLVSRDPQLGTLKTMIGKLGLVQKLKEDGQMTLFAPTDAAFKKLKPGLLNKLLDGSKCLENLVQSHVLPNVICSSVIQGRVRSINVLDTYLNLTRSKEDKLFVDGAQIVSRDVMATNGVLHVIDEVLIPDNALDILDVAEKAGATQFLALIESAGLEKSIQTMDNITMFIPTNDALQNMPDDMKDELNADPTALAKLIRYHISTSGELTTRNFRTGMKLDTVDSDKKIKIDEYFSAPFGMRQQQTAQCSPLKRKNIPSCNGMAHMVSQVMMPPKGDILHVLSLNSSFSRLVELFKRAGMAEDLQGQGPYTLFAPTNQAFDDVDEEILGELKADVIYLKKFLQYHIMKGSVCCAGVFPSHWFWKQREWSMEGSFLQLSRKDGEMWVNKETTISRCDISASNGIIHAVDSVLPEAWRKYAPKSSEEEREEEDAPFQKFWDHHWDKAFEHMRDLDWLDMGWKWDERKRK